MYAKAETLAVDSNDCSKEKTNRCGRKILLNYAKFASRSYSDLLSALIINLTLICKVTTINFCVPYYFVHKLNSETRHKTRCGHQTFIHWTRLPNPFGSLSFTLCFSFPLSRCLPHSVFKFLLTFMIRLYPLFVTSKMKQKVPNGARKVWSSKSQRERGRYKPNSESLVSLLYASFASYTIIVLAGGWGACALNIKGRALIIFYGPTPGQPAGAGRFPNEHDHVRDRWHSFKAHLSQLRSLPSFVFYVFCYCFYFSFSTFGNDI